MNLKTQTCNFQRLEGYTVYISNTELSKVEEVILENQSIMCNLV